MTTPSINHGPFASTVDLVASYKNILFSSLHFTSDLPELSGSYNLPVNLSFDLNIPIVSIATATTVRVHSFYNAVPNSTHSLYL